MHIIVFDLSRERVARRPCFPGGIFVWACLGGRDGRQWLASDLLFDNLVSDLQFFCQPRLYQMAEGSRDIVRTSV
jgi:hypothetical protein